MPKRGLGTQVAVFAVIVVCVVAAIGVVSLTQSEATSGSATSSNEAIQATFLYRTMPKEFAVGGYKFYMEYNGTYLVTTENGTVTANTGFNLELTVSNGLTNQTTTFGWAPPAPSPGVLPTPASAMLFGGGLQLAWFSNSTGTYLRASLNQVTSTTEAATTCAPSPGEAGNATVTITQTAQGSGCACAAVDSNSNGTLYVSTNAVVGDDVCIAAQMSESTIVSFEVVGPTGVVFSTPGCVNSAFTAVGCGVTWDTAQPDPRGNPIQPGDYELTVSGDSQSLQANFTLGPSTASVTSTTTSCTATGGIGCPHFMNSNWTISVSYTGPWSVTYQGWLGDQTSGQLVVSGSFYGNASSSKTINVSGTTDYGITVCAEAQKLDSSASTLTVSILPPNVTNQTSVAYGTAKTCVADEIV